MSKFLTGLAMTAAVLAGGLVAAPALAAKARENKPGTLNVFDEGKLFSQAGIDQARAAMSGTMFDHGLTVTIDTYASIPKDKEASYSEDKKAQFFKSWAQELAKNDKARGIYVLVCRSPGYVEVIADKETRDRGFNFEDEKTLRDKLLTAFRGAKDKPEAEQVRLRDDGLKAAVSFVVSDLKDTTVAGGTHNTSTNTTTNKKAGGMSIGGWICLGLCILLGVWLVIGLIRALTGGGGGGGGGYGPGGGGGGGGFMSSMFGGLFGAMAGMWLYNNMFGHSGMMGGSDAYAGDTGATGGGDTGAGDFSGDQGAGGSFDDAGGGGGGGDWGGGGGDYGGGGDWGGGGGDFGGGGGDF